MHMKITYNILNTTHVCLLTHNVKWTQKENSNKVKWTQKENINKNKMSLK